MSAFMNSLYEEGTLAEIQAYIVRFGTEMNVPYEVPDNRLAAFKELSRLYEIDRVCRIKRSENGNV